MTKLDNALDKVLEQEFKQTESIFNGKYSKTALFLLRMIDLNLNHPFMVKYLSNAFLDDVGLTHSFVRPIFLLFKVKNYVEKDFVALCDVLRKLSYYRYDYDIGKQDGHYLVMIVFETPEHYKSDYYHFKQGRYSQMSDRYKSLFPKENKTISGQTESVVWGALHKSPELKNRVAKIMCAKDEKESPREFKEFRDYLDTLDEIWAKPEKIHEYYRFESKET